MAGKQAKTISQDNVNDLLAYASCTRQPFRNQVLVLLSAKAGLRAAEIANLTWDMVHDADGNIANAIELHDHAAKKRSGRLIPMHGQLRDALLVWRTMTAGCGPVIKSERGGPMRPLSIVVWFALAYRNI